MGLTERRVGPTRVPRHTDAASDGQRGVRPDALTRLTTLCGSSPNMGPFRTVSRRGRLLTQAPQPVEACGRGGGGRVNIGIR